jgi:hypothetical protein
VAALKFYETAYSLLQEVLGLSVIYIRLSFFGLSFFSLSEHCHSRQWNATEK